MKQYELLGKEVSCKECDRNFYLDDKILLPNKKAMKICRSYLNQDIYAHSMLKILALNVQMAHYFEIKKPPRKCECVPYLNLVVVNKFNYETKIIKWNIFWN